MKHKRSFHLEHLAFGIVVLSVIFAGLSCGQKGEVLYNYVPEDVFVISTLDFKAFTQLDQYKDLSETFGKGLTEALTDKKFEKFMKDTDIDLKRDLFKATLVLSPGAGMNDPKVAGIIKMAYKKEKFITALKNSSTDVTEKTYNDIPLWIIEPDKLKEEKIVLGFINPSYLVIGMETQVKKVIDTVKGKTKSVHANKKMEKFLNIASKGHIIALSYLISDELKTQKGPFQQLPVDLNNLESLIFTLNKKSTVLRGIGSNYEENKKIVNFLNGIKGMTAAMQPKSDQDKQTVAIYKDASIEAFEEEIRITIPTDKILKLFSTIFTKNLFLALQKGKQKATMGDMKSIASAIESYITDTYHAPEGSSLVEIKDQLEPFYIKKLPLKDAWGNDFIYMHGTGDEKETYGIASAGKDGVFNGWEQSGDYIITTMEGFRNDIIFSNGLFTYYPKLRR